MTANSMIDKTEKAVITDFDQTHRFVTLVRSEYEEMQARVRFLECLQAAGVDNWDGYDYAQEMVNDGELNG